MRLPAKPGFAVDQEQEIALWPGKLHVELNNEIMPLDRDANGRPVTIVRAGDSSQSAINNAERVLPSARLPFSRG